MESERPPRPPSLIIPLSGAFGSGKTKIFEAAKEILKHNKNFYFMPDLSRKWLDENEIPVGKLTYEQKIKMQTDTFVDMMRHMNYADQGNKTLVADSFLLESLAYSKDVIPPRLLAQMRTIVDNIMREKHRIWRVLHFPALPITKNELTKTTTQEFQKAIDALIFDEIKRYNVPYFEMRTYSQDKAQNLRLRINDAVTKIMATQKESHNYPPEGSTPPAA